MAQWLKMMHQEYLTASYDGTPYCRAIEYALKQSVELLGEVKWEDMAIMEKIGVVSHRNELQDEIERLKAEVQFCRRTMLEMRIGMIYEYGKSDEKDEARVE